MPAVAEAHAAGGRAPQHSDCALVKGEIAREAFDLCAAYAAAGQGSARDRSQILTDLGYAAMLYVPVDNPAKPAGMEMADDFWVRAALADPDDIEPLLARATLKMYSETPSDALPILERAAVVAPRDWRVHTVRANALYYARFYDDALEAARRSIELSGSQPRSFTILGRIHFALRQWPEAIAALRQAVETYSAEKLATRFMLQEPLPWPLLAKALDRSGDSAAAAKVMSDFIRERPAGFPDPFNLVTLADYQEHAGDTLAAAKSIEIAIQQGAQHPTINLGLRRAELLLKAGQTDDGRAAIVLMAERGDKHTILQLQVFLKNAKVGVFTINGKFDAATRNALEACLRSAECTSRPGLPL